MEEQRRREIRGQEPRLERTAKRTQIYSVRGEVIEMNLALAIVDQPTQDKPEWSCGLTARKEGKYQHDSAKRNRRDVQADRIYYIQSAYPFQ